MKQISDEKRLRSWTIKSLFLYVISQGSIVYLLSRSQHMQDLSLLQRCFDLSCYLNIKNKVSPEAWLDFKTHFMMDTLHPFFYMTFLSFYYLYVQQLQNKKPSVLFFSLILFSGACDLLENTLHLLFDGAHAETFLKFIPLAATFSYIKWSLALGILAFCLSHSFIHLKKRQK